MKENYKILLLLLFVFASRIPFLFAGYGAEEDSWGVALNAMLMARTHIYEYSRIPGHPVQEYFYAFLPVKSAWAFNACTALMSTLCVFFFYLICKKMNAPAITGALMLAFTPVFFVNSSNDLDYNWALCFMLAAFYFMLNKKNTATAICVGLAVGCRITSGAILLPLAFYLFTTENDYKKTARFVLLSLFVCAMVFAPVIARYGKDFFGYVNQFGVPPVLKTIFKGTIGVWGIVGLFFIAILFLKSLVALLKKKFSPETSHVIYTCIITIVLFTTSYLWEPHKAAYLIPVIPFVILFILLLYKNKKIIYPTTIVLMLNCFFMGVNLADDNRSAPPSKLAVVKKINNNKIAVDVLKGNVIDDYQKRKARMEFAENVIQKTSAVNKNTLVIAGYWLNNILVQQHGRENANLTFVYYVDEKTLRDFKAKDFEIFCIAGQEKLNDGCYQGKFTDKYVKILN